MRKLKRSYSRNITFLDWTHKLTNRRELRTEPQNHLLLLISISQKKDFFACWLLSKQTNKQTSSIFCTIFLLRLASWRWCFFKYRARLTNHRVLNLIGRLTDPDEGAEHWIRRLLIYSTSYSSKWPWFLNGEVLCGFKSVFSLWKNVKKNKFQMFKRRLFSKKTWGIAKGFWFLSTGIFRSYGFGNLVTHLDFQNFRVYGIEIFWWVRAKIHWYSSSLLIYELHVELK